MEKYLTPEEMAEYICRAKGTVDNWRSMEVGPPYMKVNSRIMYKKTEVDKWLDKKDQRNKSA